MDTIQSHGQSFRVSHAKSSSGEGGGGSRGSVEGRQPQKGLEEGVRSGSPGEPNR